MNNLGKANVKVELYDYLPGIDSNAIKYNFDVSAWQWNTMQNSPYFPPFLAEHIESPDSTLAAVFPSKRKKYIDNYINYTGTTDRVISTTKPYILWTPTMTKEALLKHLFDPTVSESNPTPYDDYVLIPPQEEISYPSDYIGPQWRDDAKPELPATNDIRYIKQWLTQNGSLSAAGTWIAEPETDTVPYTYWINQDKVKAGLWWGVESHPFITQNMPLWVNLTVARTPPAQNNETLFVISLGIDDSTQAYDILLSQNNRMKIYDYTAGRPAAEATEAAAESGGTSAASVGSNIVIKEFDVDFTRMLDSEGNIEIGLMTIGGRMVIWINKDFVVYERIEKEDGDAAGTFKECKIAAGRMRIYGTNVQAIINVCPMTFAPMAVIALPLPSIYRNSESEPISIVYKGVHRDGTLEGSVAVLPQPLDRTGTLYGVDCRAFLDSTGMIFPSGIGLHQRGRMVFATAEDAELTSLPDTSFYLLVMRSEAMPFNNPEGVLNISSGGCPYFFRIKGGYNSPLYPVLSDPVDVPEVITVSESITAPDYFHAIAKATVTIYNEGGRYDYLRDRQKGIRLYWGWGTDLQRTFTGVITSVATSEVPGKETMTLQCDDYFFPLKNTPIINSPFYDGMVGYYAIEDLAKRGGVMSFSNDMDTPEDYFLPSGYCFSQPKHRFPGQNMLFACMMDLIKRFEAFVYFDSDGMMHIKSLPGGLFSSLAGEPIVAEFARNPTVADVSRIILNERAVDYSFESTVNKISVYTLDRDTRNAILYTKVATAAENRLGYRRIKLLDQPALGDLEVARTYATRLSRRIFYPIRKTTFSTVGTVLASSKILSFVKIDELEYRLLSITKKYSSDSNDFTCEFSGEWLGGAGT
jgi:hypothetical protein